MNKLELLQVAKPILFNTEMVKAILEGRKTVTRRVCKSCVPEKAEWGYTAFTPKGCISCRGYFESSYGEKFYKLKYSPGDILYVRETWQCINPYSDKEYVYRASCDEDYATDIGRWLPSIHMPKSAARLFLKVTDVRVERLQDITMEGARAEGAINRGLQIGLEGFVDLWDSTIKKQDLNTYGWEANPWVWVYKFERLEVQ